MEYGPSPIIDVVKNVMKERGLSRKQIAQLIDKKMSPTVISHWTHGNAMPSEEHLVEIAKLAKIPLEELILEKTRYSCLRKGIHLRRLHAVKWAAALNL